MSCLGHSPSQLKCTVINDQLCVGYVRHEPPLAVTQEDCLLFSEKNIKAQKVWLQWVPFVITMLKYKVLTEVPNVGS